MARCQVAVQGCPPSKFTPTTATPRGRWLIEPLAAGEGPFGPAVEELKPALNLVAAVERKKIMPDTKCAHSPCSCKADSGSQYCSVECESASSSSTECDCGHDDCSGAEGAEEIV